MIGGSTTLNRVLRGQLCTGCGACASVVDKIEMEPSSDGFNRPVPKTALNWAEDSRIRKICPGLQLHTPGHPEENPLWGRIVSLRKGYATGPALRFRASSGGALSAILVHLIESGAVDFVLHTGADPNDPTQNRTIASHSRDEIANAAGSRYAPSSPLAEIEAYLRIGRRFAFVGKPCDIAALRAMAKSDERIDQSIPWMLSFFCAGVPSRRGADEILSTMQVPRGSVSKFRYRGNGWPGTATAVLNDGTRRSMSYRDSWGRILSRHVQFRCKICPDGSGRSADIVCGDAWTGDERGYPVFEEGEGQSTILARTHKGETLIRSAIEAGLLRANIAESNCLDQMQPGQVNRMRAIFARMAALWLTAQPRPNFAGFRLWRLSLQASPVQLLRNFLGTGRRVLMGRK